MGWSVGRAELARPSRKRGKRSRARRPLAVCGTPTYTTTTPWLLMRSGISVRQAVAWVMALAGSNLALRIRPLPRSSPLSPPYLSTGRASGEPRQREREARREVPRPYLPNPPPSTPNYLSTFSPLLLNCSASCLPIIFSRPPTPATRPMSLTQAYGGERC